MAQRLVLGAKALETLRVAPAEVADIAARVRDRDNQRLQLELANGLGAGRALFSGKAGP